MPRNSTEPVQRFGFAHQPKSYPRPAAIGQQRGFYTVRRQAGHGLGADEDGTSPGEARDMVANECLGIWEELCGVDEHVSAGFRRELSTTDRSVDWLAAGLIF